MVMRELIKNVLMQSIMKLYHEDYDNIKFGVSERNICARLAHHMENIMRKYDKIKKSDIFNNYYVDVEYNRMGNGDFKFYENSEHRPQYMVSDLLVQSRGEKNNLLALEMKRKGNYNNVAKDKERLASLVQPYSEGLQFECVRDTMLGAFVVYGKDGVDFEFFWYSSGKVQTTKTHWDKNDNKDYLVLY